LLFGVWGFLFPAGLVVYWTTSNLWQIGQQHFVLRARQREEVAIAEGRKAPPEPKKRAGLMSGLMQRAQQERDKRGTGGSPNGSGKPSGKATTSDSGSKSGRSKSGGSGSASGKSGSGKSGSGTSSTSGRPAGPDPNRPRSYKPAATSGDGRGRTAPRGTRSPYGVAADDGSVSESGPASGSASAKPSGSSSSGKGTPSSGSRSNAGSRRKRRKR